MDIRTPLSESLMRKLKAGMKVNLSGYIYTARDAAHQRIVRDIRIPPFPFKGAVIFYAGPTEKAPKKTTGSIGPTTSERMDKYTPVLLKAGLKGMIGKGERSREVLKKIRKYKAVYFVATGGVAAFYASFVKSSRIIAYDDLGCEAIRELYVEKMPLLVGIDPKGRDIFKKKKN